MSEHKNCGDHFCFTCFPYGSAGKIKELDAVIAELERKVKWMHDDKCIPCDQNDKITALEKQLQSRDEMIGNIENVLAEFNRKFSPGSDWFPEMKDIYTTLASFRNNQGTKGEKE